MQFDRTKAIQALCCVVQRMHYPLEVMLICVRWYAAYPLSFRDIESPRVSWRLIGLSQAATVVA